MASIRQFARRVDITMHPSMHLLGALCTTLWLSGCGPQSTGESAPETPVPAATVVPAEVEPPMATSAAPPQTTIIPDAIAAAVAATARPADDVARDADRKPADILTFFEVHPGEVVFELVAGGGYYTELLSRTVGDSGRVIGTRIAPERLAGARLPNVTAADDRDWGLAKDSVDLAFTSLNYHDLINLKVDRPALLKNLLTILKPGATFAVIDHSAADGSGSRDVGTLHRVDETVVVSEITAAGFKLIDTSGALRHPEDARTLAVFDPVIRGKTDQFILKFVKPRAS